MFTGERGSSDPERPPGRPERPAKDGDGRARVPHRHGPGHLGRAQRLHRLLALGLLDRFTGLVDLPAGWTWLAADASLWILGVLLALELVADKIPGVDAVNDVVQTVVGADTVTVGAAAPVLSAAEDVSAAGLVAAALFLPVLVAVLVVAVVVGLWLLARRFRDPRTRGRAAAVPGGPEWTA
ncbi:DUF4126 domain-containing protein [Micrococcus luteus]|uniref:DUF4126 domain-containing protein n=1 Tax=Micrococcus luteus TaxID=1270 RepID=UPI003D73D7C9